MDANVDLMKHIIWFSFNANGMVIRRMEKQKVAKAFGD
jgi:hypothetical protein